MTTVKTVGTSEVNLRRKKNPAWQVHEDISLNETVTSDSKGSGYNSIHCYEWLCTDV